MSRNQLVLRFIVLVFAIGGVVSAGAQTKSKPLSPSEAYALALKEAKRDGFPVSAKDLQVPMPSPEQNAAPLYKKIWDIESKNLMMTEEYQMLRNAGSGVNMTDKRAEKVRQILTTHQAILDLIHQAAEKPFCVFPQDWTKDFSPNYPDYANVRNTTYWLSAESALLLHDGKPLDAIRVQALGFRVARHAAADPNLISYLTGIAAEAMVIAGMKRILYFAGDDPTITEAVRKAVEAEARPIDLAYALRGELAPKIRMVEMMRKGGPKNLAGLFEDKPTPTQKALLKSIKDRASYNRFLDANGMTIIQTERKAVKAANLPYPEALRVMTALDREIISHKNDPAYQLPELQEPLFGLSAQKPAIIQARVSILLAATKVLEWKAKNGVFPKTLEEAMPVVPADPFDGKPLRYQQEESGFVIYSVGTSGKFDGGTPDKNPDNSACVFRYPMPKYLK